MSDPRELRNFINGEFKPPRGGETMDVVNPSTGEVYATAPKSGEGDVDDALKAAQAAFDNGWRDTTPSERMTALLKMADAIEENAEKLVDIEAENTGKPKGLTLSEEIPPMCDQIRFFAGAARMLEGKATAEYMTGFTSSIRREPIGVIGSVTPWNYPMMMAVWKFGPALAAGNTMVIKPSDTTPASTAYLAELFAEILPRGVQRGVRRPRHRSERGGPQFRKWSRSPAASPPARPWPARPPTRSSAPTSSWAGRRR